jgi:hypothetical protein
MRRPSSRTLGILALIALPLAGALIGAGLKPGSPNRSLAEARLYVDLNSPGVDGDEGRRDARVDLLADAAESAQVRGAAAEAVGGTTEAEDLVDRVDVGRVSDPGQLVIEARARDATRAAILANSVALETLSFLDNAIPNPDSTATPIGDFERGMEGWVIDSQFSRLPSFLGRTPENPRFNATSLEARCGPERACGPATIVSYPFRLGRLYTATGWLRADRPTEVDIVFGRDGDDVITSPTARVGRRWRRLTTTWSPEQNHPIAEIGFQTQTPGRVTLNVDGVLMIDPGRSPIRAVGAPLSVAQERAALSAGAYAGLVPGRATGEVANQTARSALAGAGAGLGVALAGLLCFLAVARLRRREQAEHQGDERP